MKHSEGLHLRLKAGVMAIVAMVVLMFGSPDDALAARSGGRASGSFRGSAPSKVYSGGGGSRGSSTGSSIGGGSSRTVILAPSPSPIVVSPYGFSPFGYSPFGVSPFGLFRPAIFGPSLSDIILVGGAAYVGYKIYEGIQNQKLGITDEQTVAKVQVAVFCEDRSPASLLGAIARLVDRADTSSQESMSGLVSDVALALLRKESAWISAAAETASYRSDREADDAFAQFSLRERAKIERETVNRVNGKDKSERRAGPGFGAVTAGRAVTAQSTVAVVTLLVCLNGKRVPQVKDRETLKAALLALGSDLLSGDGLMAAEVMWTPEEADDTLMPEDVTLDFPTLLPL
jgi:uncharacterized membrane protein